MDIPEYAKAVLDQIPEEFQDNGCSNSPDLLFGFNFKWACRIHDWWWCSRCHAPGQMTPEWKAAGDYFLKLAMRDALPPIWKWVAGIYRRAVRIFWWGYDTCGPNPQNASSQQRLEGRCRHNMPRPEWMIDHGSN